MSVLASFLTCSTEVFFSGRETGYGAMSSTIFGIFSHELLSDLRLRMLGSPKILSLKSLATLEATRVKCFLY